jgi:hypothetical protein
LQPTGDVVFDFDIADEQELTAGTMRWWILLDR